ncbi:MAG: hypothetical protein EOO61_08050 [Hymenobacter sp.]|nr:MAG: hypothetical protein EOO61_08050 [Hymenobacter sp.]
MKGVVLFADDEIHDSNGPEHKLYQLFREEYVVLTVDNLEHLDHALKSISNFDVIILDWEFIEKSGEFLEADEMGFGGVKLKRHPLPVLEPLKLFSKIYIYSNAEIPAKDKETFLRLFPDRVEFKRKNIRTDEPKGIEAEYELIKSELATFSAKNLNLDFSLVWSRAINQSLQSIFSELSAAHSSWLKVLYDTSKNDNLNAILEVIELMNNLLAEELVQDTKLREEIIKQADSTTLPSNPDKGAAKLFQRIYYTAVPNQDVPVMTGDIFDLPGDTYGILITPECDVYVRDKITKIPSLKSMLELLVFDKSNLLTEFSPPKPEDKGQVQKFNQDAQAKHILPSFPYLGESKLIPAVITFNAAFRSVLSSEITTDKRRYKLNAPYIQQLRQRFSSAHSRVGVPAITELVRKFNLSQAKEYQDSLPKPVAPTIEKTKKAVEEPRPRTVPDNESAPAEATISEQSEDVTAPIITDTSEADNRAIILPTDESNPPVA